jgi:hypothetical protein
MPFRNPHFGPGENIAVLWRVFGETGLRRCPWKENRRNQMTKQTRKAIKWTTDADGIGRTRNGTFA